MPVGYKNLPTESEEQIIFVADDHDHNISFITSHNSRWHRLRINTIETIQKMNKVRFAQYQKAILKWENRTHTYGTPQAICAYEYLKNATGNEQTRRETNK